MVRNFALISEQQTYSRTHQWCSLFKRNGVRQHDTAVGVTNDVLSHSAVMSQSSLSLGLTETYIGRTAAADAIMTWMLEEDNSNAYSDLPFTRFLCCWANCDDCPDRLMRRYEWRWRVIHSFPYLVTIRVSAFEDVRESIACVRG